MKNLFILFSCLTFSIFNLHQVRSAWQIEKVDSPKYFLETSSRNIAIVSNNTIHIAYGGDHLYYAYYDGSWHTETVDNNTLVGEFASLVIDSSGNPHISYYDGDNHVLKYAYYDGN